MKKSRGVAVVAHSGGPTSVINASLLGVVEQAHAHLAFDRLYGARFGLEGILSQNFIDLFQQPQELLSAVARTPSSAIGTSRRELTTDDLERVLAVFRRHDVHTFFYTGGNGSMGTAHQIQHLANESGYALQVIGIPKTIDNDLMETDHSPGYASAARFVACAVRDIGADNLALPGQVEIVEVLGRNVGWLAAATSLARKNPEDAPHLIYLPERLLPLEKLLTDVEAVYRRLNRCVVVICEGQLDQKGEPFGADVREGSRGKLAMNLGHRLAQLVSQHLKLRARSEKPGLLGRSSAEFISEVDWNESRLCGQAAVSAVLSGSVGKMVALSRPHDTYQVTTTLVDLKNVAFIEKAFPSEWWNMHTNTMSPSFYDYAFPLVGPIQHHARLETLSLADISKASP